MKNYKYYWKEIQMNVIKKMKKMVGRFSQIKL